MDRKAKIVFLKASRKLIEAVLRLSSDDFYFSHRLGVISLEIFSMIGYLESEFYTYEQR